MWLRRNFLIITSICMLSACGFEPIYADRSTQHIEVVDLLASVIVKAPKDQNGELLKAAVEDLLNPEARAITPNYRLDLQMQMAAQPFIFNSDGTAGLYEVTLTVPYNLSRIADNKKVYKGRVSRSASYNVSESDDYATFVSKNDAFKRVTREAAEDIKLRLGAYFASLL